MLIWNPCVTVIGQTQFDPDGFEQWMLLNGLGNHQSAHPDSPLHALWSDVSDEYALERMVEFGGRHCYRSWMNGRSRADYVRNIIEMGHGSVLEHSTLNLAIQGVSRSLSHELVRHRVGVAISQESQRYVEASDSPVRRSADGRLSRWRSALERRRDQQFYRAQLRALDEYKRLQSAIVSEIQRRESKVKSLTLIKKRANEAARAHLPNAAETRLLWTANLRLLRHFLWLRGGAGADLEIRRLAVALLDDAQQRAPTVFEDMAVADGSYGVPIIVAKS